MTEDNLKLLTEYFERLSRECNTREKAIAQLQGEGLLDEDGKLPARYGGPGQAEIWL